MFTTRILQLHSSFIEYEPLEREAQLAEECEKGKKKLEDLVVLFTCVEEGDDEAVAKEAISAVRSSLEKLGVNRVLIYPYAHLSSNLAPPFDALKVLKEMERDRPRGFDLFQSAFNLGAPGLELPDSLCHIL